MRATRTDDFLAPYVILDDLVARIKLAGA